jgi:hypothetical protein
MTRAREIADLGGLITADSSGAYFTGNVGIGTSAPVQVLHLGGASNKAIQITSATSNAGYFGVYQDQAGFTVNRDASNGTFADAVKQKSSGRKRTTITTGKTEAAIKEWQVLQSLVLSLKTTTNSAWIRSPRSGSSAGNFDLWY